MRISNGVKQFNKGYIGIPEILVVTAIILILTLVALINYPAAKKQLALQRSASQLVQDIRRVQEMALASEIVGNAIPTGGYGIHLRRVPPASEEFLTSYIFFVDSDAPFGMYSPGSEEIDKISLESGIKIKNLDANHVNIIFIPPDPTVNFTNQDGENLGNQISIVISLTDETKTKTIRVNKAGLIYVE